MLLVIPKPPLLASPRIHRGYLIFTKASGVVTGSSWRPFASQLAILVHSSQRAEEWLEQLCLPSSDSPYKGEEGGIGANISILILAFGRVHHELDAVLRALQRTVTLRFWFLANVSMGALRALAPKPIGYFVIVIGGTEVVSLSRMKNVSRARTLQWASVKQSNGKSLAMVIDKEERFSFRLYAFVYRDP